jgi:hypothetical protein
VNRWKEANIVNTQTYLEAAKEIPVYGSFDVVVVGGGCAGIAAAIAASRNGAKTLIIERFGYFGGTATASLMANINAFRNQKEPDYLQTTRGIGEEIIREMHKAGGLGMSSYEQEEYDLEQGDLAYSYAIDPEVFKYVSLKLVVEAGVKILFHTYFSDVIMDGQEIKGIIVENKSGRQAIFGRVFIDASGDADVAFKAGVPYWQIEYDEDHRMEDQLMYRITGFPLETEEGPVRGSIANKCMTIWGPPAPKMNGTNADDLTNEEIVTRLNIYKHFEELKAKNPALKDAVLIDTGPLIGIRQTRFIEGDYRLTAEDALSGRRFDDVIALCSSPIIRYYGYRRYLEHEGYDIPYRCLLPKKVEGMLVAGRCISSDQASYESYRAMAPVMSLGEAAGVAAAIAVSDKVHPRYVDVKKLQKTLISQGAELGQNRRS